MSSNKIAYDRDFSDKSYGEMVDSLNTLFQGGIEFGANLSGQIIKDIELPVNESVDIPHNLKITPKYMIILRSRGGCYNVVDGDSKWTDRRISLKSIGGSGTQTITILLMRG